MEIQKDERGKWLRASYGSYLTNASATIDIDKVIVTQVYVPNTESNDEWSEITEEDYEKIKKAKETARGSVNYPEAKVNQMIGLFATSINKMELTDEQALEFKDLYPQWKEFIGEKLEANFKVNHNDKLYKTRQVIETVLDQEGYRPGEVGSESLYEEINEKNKGTFEDPIPYNNNMELFVGKYYSQSGVTYKCTRNTGQAVFQNLNDLVGIYVEIAEE